MSSDFDDDYVRPNPAQPDGGAQRCHTCGSPMCCGTPNFGAPIPPASPEREAVYRALGEWLDAMEVTAKAAQSLSPASGDPYKSAQFTDKLAHQRFAEAASAYRMTLNAAARKESSNAD